MPEALAGWLGSWPGAALIRHSATAYLLVNATHILGIGLLVGAILPLDLRLAGILRGPGLGAVGPFLVRTASIGLGLALATGAWLFTVRPAEYAANPAFLAKMGFLLLALLTIALQHRAAGLATAFGEGRVPARTRLFALLSASLWLGVLLAGRWIGFV